MTHIQVINDCIRSYSNNKVDSINVLMQHESRQRDVG